MIAIVVLTHNRVHLLRQCVEKVLGRISEQTTEIVIWDNGSTDGTAVYLDSLDDPRIRVVHHPENIGQNAYAEAFRLTSAPFMLELDDDMIDAPDAWVGRCWTRSKRCRRSVSSLQTSWTTRTTRHLV